MIDRKKLSDYTINFNNGCGMIHVFGTIQKAQAIADDYASYTGEDITIEEKGKPIMCRRWHNDDLLENDKRWFDLIIIGEGYYDEWLELQGDQ